MVNEEKNIGGKYLFARNFLKELNKQEDYNLTIIFKRANYPKI